VFYTLRAGKVFFQLLITSTQTVSMFHLAAFHDINYTLLADLATVRYERQHYWMENRITVDVTGIMQTAENQLLWLALECGHPRVPEQQHLVALATTKSEQMRG